ncbi:hypothetical protein CBR_g54230 [Chara braunii]|uniref:Peptidase A1 domain-containing protein n=1 Tax=Chara braunii TaxID=69332 RepID=A0A388K7B7_CHABU|nr:hypothetical protein CBR_g54230 [Chara braunii]GBG65938.1 hypothetical protein CBR_g54230 [Chara braunii]|eukprot:GBG65936.1 hypothetical protein CBR_g54230 [Chara braunii]
MFFTIAVVLEVAMALPSEGPEVMIGGGPDSPIPGPQNLVLPVRYQSSPTGYPRFYVSDFVLGMPRQERCLSISGSSDLTWTFTSSSDQASFATPNAPNPRYQWSRSRTARKVTCAKGGCKTIFNIGPGVGICENNYSCHYNYPLVDQSVVHGFAIRELVGLKNGFGFAYSRVGCTIAAEGPVVNTVSDGALSLTRSPNSFFKAMIGTLKFSPILSMCLNASAGANFSGVVIFGSPREEVQNGPTLYTPIVNVTTPELASKFLIQVTQWCVGKAEQTESFSAYVDPATDSSFLPQATFETLVSKVNNETGMAPDPNFTAGINATCYVKQTQTCDGFSFPDLNFKFGSANLTVSGEHYMFTTTGPNGTGCAKCLGIFGWSQNVSSIGANLIQETWVVQDMRTWSVGFVKKGTCY